MQETVLTHIVADKRIWLQARKKQQPLETFQAEISPSTRDFYNALRTKNPAFILECKKASPSKGVIRADFDPVKIAKVYKNYASAISVLTDEAYFQGNFDFLTQVSRNVSQPVLCKDFIVDPYQIYLARYYHADACLLMLSVLNDDEYRALSAVAHALNMGVLTEVSNDDELARAIALKAKVIGINNRDLRDLSIDLNRTRNMAPKLPPETIIISESGIYNHAQIQDLHRFVNGFLIGSALMSENNLDFAVRKVIFGENKVCGLTRETDAIAAYHAGAVYGGLIFVPNSPRFITQETAKYIMRAAPLQFVGVFRDEMVETVVKLAQQLALFAVQLHGNEDQHYIDQLRQKLPKNTQIWKAFSITTSLPNCDLNHVDKYLFDNGNGGSGNAFNWTLFSEKSYPNVLLAGGINPENCTQAARLGCAGLDINSGVESVPGIKDHNKISAIFQALRAY